MTDELEGIPTFLAVAEAKGFRAAGNRLGVSGSAVSHALRRLEERLGVALVQRTTRSVHLTEAGERLYAAVRPALEEARAAVRAVGLDKTGTLTEGRPEVVHVLALDGGSGDEVLALAAAAEARSQHPLARAVMRHAEQRGVALRPAADVQAITGKGLRARVANQTVYLGNERLFAELGALHAAGAEGLAAAAGEGRTAVLVGAADGEGAAVRLRGLISIADRVRPRAGDALRALHRAGIARVVMLTGDNEGTARAVAGALGVAAPAWTSTAPSCSRRTRRRPSGHSGRGTAPCSSRETG